MECTAGLLNFLNCYANLSIALFTLGLFFATLALWVATRNLVKQSDANAERQVRAYVSVVNAQIDRGHHVDGRAILIVTIELKNAGQTPAYEFSTWLQPPVILSPGEECFGEPRYERDRTGHSILGPGVSVTITQIMALESESELAAGSKRVYLFGGAYYRDAFRRRRHFTFRSVSGDPTGVTQLNGSFSVQRFSVKPHQMGYDAD